MRIAETALAYPSGLRVVWRRERTEVRREGGMESRRMPLSLRRNSGFDQERHSGESMWRVVLAAWEGVSWDVMASAAATMEAMGSPSSRMGKRFGRMVPGVS